MDRTYYNNIISYLMNGTVGPGETDEEKTAIVKRASKYKVISGVLYHKGKGRGIEDLRLVLVDPPEQENAIRTCHVSETSGRHFGRNKTASLLAAKYYWRMMYTDVMQYIANCPTCSLDRELLDHKSTRDRTKVWKLVEVEFLENFHTTRHYTFHLLRIADVFSKWTRCVPMHSNSERNIVSTVLEQFGSFGFPVGIRFVNCKTVPAYLAALQKELELFIKRATEATPVLSAAGVNMDGILTCFQDMTVHVSVEDDGENSLSDFDSFEEYLRTFHNSRGRESITSPVFHILFGKQSVVEEPIRQWLMDKIVYLKKQNPYGWASQMSFYVFCLQNSIPPTMNQSPFSIMFNRQPPQETLWCWYGNTQNVHVYDESLDGSRKATLSKSTKKKEKVSSSLSSVKRSLSSGTVETSAKKVRLDWDKRLSSGLSSSAKGKSKEKVSKTLASPEPNIYKKEFNSLRRQSRQNRLSSSAPSSGDSKIASHKIGTSRSHLSFEESLNSASEYIMTKSFSSRKSKDSKFQEKNFGSSSKSKEKVGLPKSREERKKLKGDTSVEKSSVGVKKAELASCSSESLSAVPKKSKDRTCGSTFHEEVGSKKFKDCLLLTESKGEGLSSPKKSKEHKNKTNSSTVDKKSKDGKSRLKSNGDGFTASNECTVVLKSNNKVVISRACADSSASKTSSKNINSKLPSKSEKIKAGNSFLPKQTKGVAAFRGTESVTVAASDASLPVDVTKGEILRSLSVDQPQSALKRRFPGRPYKKNRKYVDMATEVSIHRPQEAVSTVKSPSAVADKVKTAKSAPSQERFARCPKMKANGEETSSSTRYSFRRNLKPRGPSSYIHRFIAISSSKRTTSTDNEVEILGVHPFDPVEEIVCDIGGQESAAEDFIMATEQSQSAADGKQEERVIELTQEELDALGALPALTNGVCDEDDEDTLLYESELCIDEGFLILAEQDLQLQVPDNELGSADATKEDDESIENGSHLDAAIPLSTDVNSTRLQGAEVDKQVTTEGKPKAPLSKDRNRTIHASSQKNAPSACKEKKMEGLFSDGECVLSEGLTAPVPSPLPLLESAKRANMKPASVILSRLSSFVTQRALEGSIQLRTVTNNGLVSIFVGSLKIVDYSLDENRICSSSVPIRKIVHKRKLEEKRRLKCGLCSKTYLDTPEELELHMRFHDDASGLSCPICKKTGQWKSLFKHFFSHKDVASEMEAHSKHKKMCSLCQKIFATEEGLAKHTRLMHPPETDQFRCGECELSFKDPKSFKRHQEIHDNITYECGECGYTTKAHYNYILHAKFHESQRLDFAKEGQSTKIINATLDEKGMLTCGQCSVKTASDQELIQHMQACHNKTKTFYCCDQCSKKFRSQAQLCSHILMHKSVASDLFICKLCPYTSKFKHIMHKHAKRHHPNFALKDVVQGPRKNRRPGRPAKEVQKKTTGEGEEELEVKEEGDQEDDIPTATVVVHTDENGELTVCEDEEDNSASQIICVDADGNFVLDEAGQTLQFLEGDQQLVVLQVNPEEADGTS